MTEEWRPYPPAPESYLVSEYGKIFALPRIAPRPKGGDMRVGNRQLKASTDRKGYLYYRMFVGGKWRRVTAHGAVMEAFVGPRPDGEMVCHWDDDPANNHVSNLRYGTASDNMRDRVRNKIHHNAQRTHCRMGHEYNAENTLYRETKTCRDCLACRTEKIRLRSVYRAQVSHKKRMFKIADKLDGFVAVSKKWVRDE